MNKVRNWLSRWNGFPDGAVPFVALICFFVTITRDRGYITMALLIFMLIYLELRQIRRRLGHVGLELPDDMKTDPT